MPQKGELMKWRAAHSLLLVVMCPGLVAAQSYPAKSVRIVALKLGESMGQQFVVDNRSGAGDAVPRRAAFPRGGH